MNEESLFHAAVARSTPQERAAFLDAACAGQPELRAAVESLLAAHEQPGTFLPPPAVMARPWPGESGPETTPGEAPSAPEPAHETENLAGSTGANGAPALSTSGQPRTSPDSAAPAAPAADLPERVGRYEIRRLLGRGGMGAVYLAHDPELDRPVALKVPKLFGPDAEERFLREARAAAAVSHPNLCPVHDVGRADGVPYLAMAFVPGPTLTEMLGQDGPPPIARCAAIAAAVACGMAEAHRHGIVHRDLKPGNILLDRKGEPVVTDFGLALRASRSTRPADPATTAGHNPRLTQSGVLMGTPAYMPPEQARGDLDRIGPASDVYALGAILYELLTGRPPFPTTPLEDMVRLIETEPAPVPSKLRGQVPPGLDAVCRRAMAKNPAERFPSMEAFAEALAAFVAPRRRGVRGAVAAAGLALFLAVAGAVFYVKTDYGTVEVRIDPTADVRVAVDGNEIMLTEGGRVTRLRAGPHELDVKGEGFETQTKLFRVKRGERTPVEVELKPRLKPVVGPPRVDPPADPPKPPGPAPGRDRARLADLLARGRKLMDEGRGRELGVIATEALRIDPESPRALGLRAIFRSVTGKERKSVRDDIEAALRLNPETLEALILRAQLDGEEAKYADAIADMTVAIRLVPKHPIAWDMRARGYLGLKEYRQAESDATRAILNGYQAPDVFPLRAGAYVWLGEYDKALKDLDIAIRRVPGDPALLAQRSVIHAKLGHAELAAADRKQAKEAAPNLPESAWPALPNPPKPTKRKKLTPDEAKAVAATLQDARTAWDRGRVADCERSVEEVVRIDPTSAPARELRARLWGQQRLHRESLKEADEAVRLDPTFAPSYGARGSARGALGDAAGAIADLTIGLTIDPTVSVAWNNRGWVYMERGQYHQALADLNEAIRLKPDAPEAVPNRGMCYLHLGDYEKALADYTRATELQPTVGQWPRICAAIRTKLGDAPGAAKDRERALKRDPQLANAPEITLPVPLPPVKKDPELPPDKP